MKHGGKRKGAGRKPAIDKKQTVVLYIETSIINQLGGIDNAKLKLYNFARIESGENNCNLHIVSKIVLCRH